MEHRPDGSTDAEMIRLMAATIASRAPEAKHILITGDLPADQLTALAAALQDTGALRAQVVTAAESILTCAATVPQVTSADAIVLAADCTCSHYTAVNDQNEQIQRLGGEYFWAASCLNEERHFRKAAAARGGPFFLSPQRFHQSIRCQLPGPEGLVEVVAVAADLNEQAAGGQVLIVKPVAEQHRAGEPRVKRFHRRLPPGRKAEVLPPVGQLDAPAIVTPADDHDLRGLLPRPAPAQTGAIRVPLSVSMASRWTSSTILMLGYFSRYCCTTARLLA